MLCARRCRLYAVAVAAACIYVTCAEHIACSIRALEHLVGCDTDQFWHWSMLRNTLALWSSYLDKNIVSSVADWTSHRGFMNHIQGRPSEFTWWEKRQQSFLMLVQNREVETHPKSSPKFVSNTLFGIFASSKVNWKIFDKVKRFLRAVRKSLAKVKCRVKRVVLCCRSQ